MEETGIATYHHYVRAHTCTQVYTWDVTYPVPVLLGFSEILEPGRVWAGLEDVDACKVWAGLR